MSPRRSSSTLATTAYQSPDYIGGHFLHVLWGRSDHGIQANLARRPPKVLGLHIEGVGIICLLLWVQPLGLPLDPVEAFPLDPQPTGHRFGGHALGLPVLFKEQRAGATFVYACNHSGN